MQFKSFRVLSLNNKICCHKRPFLLPPSTKLGQGYVFTRVCDSVHRNGGVSRPTPRGEVEESGRGGVSRPTPQGVVEGSGRGVSRPTHRGGRLRGLTRGVSSGGGSASLHAGIHPLPTATAAGCTYPTGMHSCSISKPTM